MLRLSCSRPASQATQVLLKRFWGQRVGALGDFDSADGRQGRRAAKGCQLVLHLLAPPPPPPRPPQPLIRASLTHCAVGGKCQFQDESGDSTRRSHHAALPHGGSAIDQVPQPASLLCSFIRLISSFVTFFVCHGSRFHCFCLTRLCSLDLRRPPLFKQKSMRVNRSVSDPGVYDPVVSSFKSAACHAGAALPIDSPVSPPPESPPPKSSPPDSSKSTARSATLSPVKSDKCCLQ
jgi:hypothetical protein